MFSLRNKLMKLNGYFYKIIILLFGRSLLIKIIIFMGMANVIHTQRNNYLSKKKERERNSYSSMNEIHFPKTVILFIIIIIILKASFNK
jgi:uncharacterized membrane protein YidH (DUF202 family)